jgi:thiol-disulfide isomerase/thioredoxin
MVSHLPNAFRRFSLVVGVTLLLSACAEREGEVADEPLVEGAVEVFLTPQVPDEEAGRRIRWSPYGQQLALNEVEGGMEANLQLGPEGTGPVRLLLTKSEGAQYFDRLSVDVNRDGEFDATEVLETEVSESRNKFWSSFEAVVGIPVLDPQTGGEVMNSYPLSLWHVEDPRVEDEESVIRFSRDGWMEGSTTVDGVEAVLMVTESVMDGVFAVEDSWAIASRDSAQDILQSGNARSMDEHNWLFEQAYQVVDVDASGRRLVIAPFDPGITRAEEIAMNDDLAVDRNAPRSGGTVAFLHDFEEAEAQARAEGKPLFVDFETTWCGPCKIMDEWVYTADGVVDASAAVIAVKVDGDERLDLKDRFGVTGFPTMILLAPDGEELRRTSGYVNVVDMTALLGSAQ